MLKKDLKELIYIVFSKNNLKIYNCEKQLIFKFYSQNLISKKNYQKIKKKFINKKIIICFEKDTYLKKEVYEEEIFEIENYIQEVCVEELKKESDKCFIKYYKSEKKYNIYIFDREFIEKIVEFFLENKIIVNSLYIDMDLKNIINDYDLILKQIKKINYKLILITIIIGIIFLGNKIYENKLRDSIKIIKSNQEKVQKENYKIKAEINKIVNDKKNINVTKRKKNIKNKIKNNFFILLSLLNENIFIQKYNINDTVINIEGYIKEEIFLFKFIEKIDMDSKIKFIKYDYIYLKEGKYRFSLEIEVI